jgi:hypothetical protein
MHHGREGIFADELGHGTCRSNVPGGKRCKARRIHVADVAMKGYRLAVTVDKKNGAGRALNADPRQDVFQPLKLVFLQDKRRVWNLV